MATLFTNIVKLHSGYIKEDCMTLKYPAKCFIDRPGYSVKRTSM